MRVRSDLFTVNGYPLFAPDENVEMSFEDLDSEDSGRSETGEMFRIVVRYKVGKWTLEYAAINMDEYIAQEALFPDAPDFQFGHPSRRNPNVMEVTRCYRSKFGIAYESKITGMIKNYKFSIIEV